MPESLFSISFKDEACNVIEKETPRQILSCELYEMFKNMFCYRTPPVVASAWILKFFGKKSS